MAVVNALPHRVVVTGLGVVSPGGIGKEAFWQTLSTGRSCVGPIRNLERLPGQRVQIAASVDHFSIQDFLDRRQARFTESISGFAFVAAKLALQDAALELTPVESERAGACIGTFAGALGWLRKEVLRANTGGLRKMTALGMVIGNPSAAFGTISLQLQLHGPCVAVHAAETAGVDAIGFAYRQIKYGDADVMIAGGSEAPVAHSLLFTFDGLGLLSHRNAEPASASRPFDRTRDGIVLGEGAAVIMLEELNHALHRRAHIYAELVGFASTYSPPNGMLWAFDPTSAARTIQLALEQAGLDANAIDYVSAHGTGLALGDCVETQALKQALGRHAYDIPVSSIKSMLGDALGAAGGMQAVACALTLERGLVPPTINYHQPDPDCDLDYVPNQARQTNPQSVMQTSFSFMGKNHILIYRRWPGENHAA